MKFLTKHLLYMQSPACLKIAEKGETNNQAVNFGLSFVIKLKVALRILWTRNKKYNTRHIC